MGGTGRHPFEGKLLLQLRDHESTDRFDEVGGSPVKVPQSLLRFGSGLNGELHQAGPHVEEPGLVGAFFVYSGRSGLGRAFFHSVSKS